MLFLIIIACVGCVANAQTLNLCCPMKEVGIKIMIVISKIITTIVIAMIINTRMIISGVRTEREPRRSLQAARRRSWTSKFSTRV